LGWRETPGNYLSRSIPEKDMKAGVCISFHRGFCPGNLGEVQEEGRRKTAAINTHAMAEGSKWSDSVPQREGERKSGRKKVLK